jgi:hypothetical protein
MTSEQIFFKRWAQDKQATRLLAYTALIKSTSNLKWFTRLIAYTLAKKWIVAFSNLAGKQIIGVGTPRPSPY